MNALQRSNKNFSRRVLYAVALLASVALLGTNGFASGLAQQESQPAQPAFTSALGAVESLFKAVQSGNEYSIAQILGGPTEELSSDNEEQKGLDRELFLQKYQEMHRLSRGADGSLTLYIGAENWPFPFPLVEKDGSWRFDADKGRNEILFRRIGENELMAMETCREFIAAEKQYRANPNVPDTEAPSPTSMVAKAVAGNGSGGSVLLHGYYFRILPGPKPRNGFVFIAYPAEYRSSGVMTFVVTKGSVIYEKDLGVNTFSIAGSMTTFHEDASWRIADE
jgi:hypothetical protein